MKLRAVVSTFLVMGASCALPGMAQERGNWRAASKTAQSVTGDIVFGNEKMTINFFSFPVAEIRPLTEAEIGAAFSDSEAGVGAGHLYRLSIPGDRRFLHKNTLCGSEETQWMATYVSGKTLRFAFFSDAKPPLLTIEGMNNGSNLCGIYTYVR